ncbi:MAG: NlpC/P60 family protein [Muribaculaceae bacterium]
MKFLRKISLLMLTVFSVSAASAQSVDDMLAELKKTVAPDGRTAIWQVNTTLQNGVVTLFGKVDSNAANQAIEVMLKEKGVKYDNRLIVLENSQELPWAFVKLSIASLRTEGRHAAEMATQGIMGTPVKVLEKDDDWYRVQMPDDYIAYVPGNSLIRVDNTRFEAWKKAKRYIVTVYQTRLVSEPKGDATVSDLVMGNILEYKGEEGKWVRLATPDGREGFVEKSEVEEFAKWAKQDFDANLISRTAHRMMGSGYLWGGTSTKLTDCSGLAKVSYFSNAIILQRDASQQALTGKKIDAADWRQAKLGDLVFFGSKSGRVTHVGIYLQDGKYIHCSGQVKINSVDPQADDYLTTPFLSISRIDGMVGTKGITAVRSHPWYF